MTAARKKVGMTDVIGRTMNECVCVQKVISCRNYHSFLLMLPIFLFKLFFVRLFGGAGLIFCQQRAPLVALEFIFAGDK